MLSGCRPHLPTLREIRAAWKGGLAGRVGTRPLDPGYHDIALFDPTRPPSHRAFSRLRFLVTVDLVQTLPGRRILDVAAGACFMAVALHRAGKEVAVNDLRPVTNALRVWGLEKSIQSYTQDIHTLEPARTGLFDIVLCAELIEHVAYPSRLLTHLKHFLRPGGHLVVTSPNGRFLGNKLPTYSQIEDPQQLEGRQFRPDADGHLFVLTLSEMRDLFKRIGLSMIVTQIFGYPPITGHLKLKYVPVFRVTTVSYGLELVACLAPSTVQERLGSHLLVCGRLDPESRSDDRHDGAASLAWTRGVSSASSVKPRSACRPCSPCTQAMIAPDPRGEYQPVPAGGMAEWSKAAVLKTAERELRGFESLSLRHAS